MTKRMLIMLLLVGVLFGGIFGYKALVGSMIKKAMSAQQAPAVTVSATQAEYQNWQPKLTSVGTMRALNGVDVSTEVAGMAQEILFQSGEQVHKGQVLVRLNTEADQALLQSLQAAAELSRTIYERDQRQYKAKAISKAALDASQADLKVKQAQAAQQQALLAKKTIRAPFDGRLGITTVSPGQYLNPGEKIVTLQCSSSVYVDFYLPQQDVALIASGQNVIVMTNTYPGRSFQGRITAINPIVDQQTRNIQVEATVANPKYELLPGMFASIEVQAGQENRYLTLPQTAITYNPYGDTVYIVEEKGRGPQGNPNLIAKQTFVTVGPQRDGQIAILKGLKQGDRVVTSGQLKLKSGSPIVINNEIQPSKETAPPPVDE